MFHQIRLKDVHIAGLGHQLQHQHSTFLLGIHHRRAPKYGDQGLPATLRRSNLQDRLQRTSILEMTLQRKEVWPQSEHLPTTSRHD